MCKLRMEQDKNKNEGNWGGDKGLTIFSCSK